MAKLDGLGRQIVECVHVLGTDATVTMVATVLGADVEVVQSAAVELGERETIHVDSDRLELTAQTTPELDDATSQRLHRRAAIALHRSGAPDEVVAAHVLHGDEVNAEWVVPTLRAEARRRERASDQLAAVELLERALRERLDGATRGSVLLQLASIERRRSPLAAAHRYREVLAVVDDRPTRFAAALQRSRCLVMAGMVPHALDQIDAIRDEIDDPQLALQADLAYITQARHSLETRPLGRARLARLSDIPLSGPDEVSSQLLGELAYERVLVGDDRESAVATASAALGGDDLSLLHDLPALTRHVVLLTLCWSGELDTAERAAKLVLARAQRRSAVMEATEAHVILFNVEWRRGELQQTLFHTDRVIAGSSDDVLSLLPAASGYKAMALAATGQTKQALATLELPGDERGWASMAGFHGYLDAAAWTYLAAEEFDQARQAALRCGALASSMGTDNPAVLSWRAAAAHAGAALGMVDEPAALALDAVERAKTFGVPAVIARALRSLAAARDDDAIELLHEAQDFASRSPDQLLRARIDLDLARVFATRGNADDAREHARRAGERAGVIGARPLEASAHALEPSRTGRLRRVTATPTHIGHLRVLGDFSLSDANGRLCTPSGVPARAIRVLAAATEPIHLEQLADRVWETPLAPDQVRSRVPNVIARTGIAGQPVIRRDGDIVYLDPRITIDAVQFEEACGRALAAPERAALQASVAATLAYSGDLLPTDPYADWAIIPRERLRLRYLTLCDRVARLATAAGLHDLAIDRLQAAIRHDPHDTTRYTTAAEILRTIGDISGAAAMRERERHVRRELGL